MKVSLFTPVPELAAEMADVIRLFYGEIAFSVNEAQQEPDLTLFHRLEEKVGAWECTFALGDASAARSTPLLERGEDHLFQALQYKRIRKRLCKQTLYDLLKKTSGIHPPWGSLTGIRPTRLVYEAMQGGASPAQAARHVGETFDLMPEKAALLGDIVKNQLSMLPPDPRQADVYIGIPFCATRCAYCSFLSGELGNGKQVPSYVEALLYEMAFAKQLMDEKGLSLRAVYVGGGTPTALPDSAFERVLQAVQTHFPNAVEYTVEAGRPDSITREKLQAINNAGVKRISINPQTMRDETLRRIGRDHSAKQTVEAYALAREMGFSHINMDVIAGLPGETAQDFAYTLSFARKLAPESLTIHTLALKRASLLRQWEAPLPDGEETSKMVRLGAETAKDMGLHPYYLYRQKYMAGNQENVGYALPGMECQYNVDIMEETTHILAVGAGAISKRIFGGELRIERAPNVSNLGEYIKRVEEMNRRKADLWR